MRKAFVSMLLILMPCLCLAQNESATLSGRVSDPTSAAIVGAEVVLKSVDTNVEQRTKTNSAGLYVFTGVHPGTYRVAAGSPGFKTLIKENLTLHVQDEVAENFSLSLGSVSETVTVSASDLHINTTDASVSTVVDQSYIKNMPLNGRSLQDLILLTPGIVTQSSQSGANSNAGNGMTGEFSVNGQRTESNYYTVDGVSANLGAAAGSNMTIGAGASGSIAAATASGTTQALVSVDDLQEFRVQSSTYSAEYGRNPGGQFAFGTKSGSNQWHGTGFDYLRNGYFAANDWFNDYLAVKQPALRQNDFGGTIGGPLSIPGAYNGKDKTFFFVSYEGLRLIAPQPAAIYGVPNLCLRGQAATTCTDSPAPAALQPVLNAFPVPNGQDFGDGWAQFTGSWSNPSSIDSTSVRFDHNLNTKLRLFFRFSDTGSNASARGTAPGGFGAPPSNNTTTAYTTRTYTGGASSVFSTRVSNDLRLNFSSNETTGKQVLDSFAGSTAANWVQLVGLNPAGDVLALICYDAFCMQPNQALSGGALQQWNLVDTVSYSVGRHQFKFGADYRRVASHAIETSPFVAYFYFGEPTAQNLSTNPPFTESIVNGPAYPLYKNFSAFAQDEWKVTPRLALSMGLRWEVNPPPGVTQGLMPFTFQGSSPDTYAVAPKGTPLWKTGWYNFAPRLGAAFTLRGTPGWETVLRGGGGVFFDTGQQLGSSGFGGPGFNAQSFDFSGLSSFPQQPSIPVLQDPTTTPPGQQYQSTPFGFYPHLQLPYTVQWNGSLEQSLGKSQALTVSYVGSHAAKLLRYDTIVTPNNQNAPQFIFIDNGLTSYYGSAQLQFRRRLAQGMTALAAYTWSHCIDYGSQNYYDFAYQRGNCDFDVRHNFSGAFSYDLPNVGHKRFVNALLHHWGLDDRFTARSGFPITVNGPSYVDPVSGKTFPAGIDLVPGQPIYLYGASCAAFFNNTNSSGELMGCPGGRAINPNAFADVPRDPNTFQPTRAGTAPRNFLRGFGAWQMDLGVRREFPLYESLKLQFRAEAFNVFNHPNFGTINTFLCSPPGCNFGQASATLANSLGILNPLYQMGGARSMQFALKLVF